MQMLWLYIDEIAGKGIGFFVLVELVGYMSVSMIPLALPIAVLISSVMILGNLAEHYELSSLKSAGVPLSRVMAPLAGVAIGIAFFSFLCSNNLIPISNLKFKSRLFDIRRQKPTLSLEQGVFNDDFKGYAIRIGEKGADNRSIKDVLIVDHTESSNTGNLLEITADHGEMYITEDEKYFVMLLYDGWQYQETKQASDDNYPFVRTSFKKWTKVFDLAEFEFDQTDPNLFRNHYSMLSAGQLINAMDSVDIDIEQRRLNLQENTEKFFYIYKKSRAKKVKEEKAKRLEKITKDSLAARIKSKDSTSQEKKTPLEKDSTKVEKTEKVPVKNVGGLKMPPPPSIDKSKAQRLEVEKKKKEVAKKEGTKKESKAKKNSKENKKSVKRNRTSTSVTNGINQIDYESIDSLETMIETFPTIKRDDLLGKAKSFARSVQGQTESAIRSLKRRRETRVNYVFEFHNKFSMAVACIIFLFIGAPMGAIVRKGGFGYPLLIAVGFFMVYMVLTIFSKNIAERFVIDPVLAAWLPCLVLFPIGLLLTYQAMNDYTRVINLDRYTRLMKFFRWIGRIASYFSRATGG